MLLWSGDRCWTRTMAMPLSVFGGIAEKKASKAAKPPADAPIPTMGKPEVGGRGAAGIALGASDRTRVSGFAALVAEAGRGLIVFFFVVGRLAATIEPLPPCRVSKTSILD